MRIPLLKGRDFDQHDTGKSSRIAIVNQTFAKSVMHTDNPVGHSFRVGHGGGARIQVIGLVADGKYASLTESPKPALFWPIAQNYNSTTTLVVRSRRPSRELVKDITRLIVSMDGRLPVYGTGSLKDMLGFALFPMHAAAISLSAFGVLALVLAITGVNGLVNYAVSRQTREIGIRIAVGATAYEVLRVVLARLALLLTLGLSCGLLLLLAAGRVLSSIVYGASSQDPLLLTAVLVSLLFAVLISSWRPTVRALRINPVNALRYE
jgi:hypothetical protein